MLAPTLLRKHRSRIRRRDAKSPERKLTSLPCRHDTRCPGWRPFSETSPAAFFGCHLRCGLPWATGILLGHSCGSGGAICARSDTIVRGFAFFLRGVYIYFVAHLATFAYTWASERTVRPTGRLPSSLVIVIVRLFKFPILC